MTDAYLGLEKPTISINCIELFCLFCIVQKLENSRSEMRNFKMEA